jgi:aromatic-L-amino-acid decarboxylase
MDWAAQLLGLSPDFLNSSGIGGGVIMTTASDSALTAVVAARSIYMRQYPETRLEDLVIYTTSQTHSLGAKAGLVLGLSTRALEVTLDNNFGLRGETLRYALVEDAVAGKKPFILIATVGTTSSGGVDCLSEIHDVVRHHQYLWVHIDAAWAGMSFACPEYHEIGHLNTINKFAHSFCTNFHKWGLVNFDASSLWVRDRTSLTNALDITPEYLRTKHGDAGTVIDYRNWHLGLGRRFRSLKIWFVLRSFGVQGIQKYIRRTVDLNNMFASLIRSSHQFTLVTPPSYALTVFRLGPTSQTSQLLNTESLNKLNRHFYGRISARTDILMTQTQLDGIFCIRFAVGAARTDETHIHRAFNLLCAEAEMTVKMFGVRV